MANTDYSILSDLANNLTTIGLLVIIVTAFLRGWIITLGRFQDWINFAEYQKERADKAEEQIKDMIVKYEQLTTILQGIQIVLSERNKSP